MKIAWILSPRSAPSRELLPYLREHAEIVLFVPAGAEGVEEGGLHSRPLSGLRPREHDQIVYAVANEAESAFVVPIARALGGTVLLHDWALPALAVAAFPGLRRSGVRGTWLALREAGIAGARAQRAWLRRGASGFGPAQPPAWNRSIVRWADAFLVHSEWMAQRIRVDRNASTPIAVLPIGAERRWTPDDRRDARLRLGLEPERDFVLTSAGPLCTTASVELLFAAVARIHTGHPRLRLLVAGARTLAREDVSIAARAHGVAALVRDLPAGRAGELDALRAADVVLHLGGAASGEGHCGVSAAFSFARPVVVEDRPEFSELSSLPIRRVAPADPSALARAIVELMGDPARREAAEAEVRHHVEERAHWSIVAQRCAEALARFPHARSARRPLVVAMLRAREEERRRRR